MPEGGAFGHGIRTGSLWAPPLPTTAELLTTGGDTRIEIDPVDGINMYGCPPVPEPVVAAFGSSTASTISAPAFAAADRLRSRLLRAMERSTLTAAYTTELDRLRRELLELCGLSGNQAPDVVFAASGTDLHLFAAQLVAAASPAPALSVMVDAGETGSGVPAALAGRGFSASTPLGDRLPPEAALGGKHIEVRSVAIREADGRPRNAADIDADVEQLVDGAAAAGRPVLLTLVDVSKTGIIAPSLVCAVALQRRWPGQVEVLIDGCQFRLARATVSHYLAHGFLVAVTGSKFLTGPAFSGALLVSRGAGARMRDRQLPAPLRAFSARADWPRGWAAAADLRDTANPGLLLRWEAAVEELRAFSAVPEAAVARFLTRFATAAAERLRGDPIFEPLAVPALDRTATGAPQWDSIPTIFPFLLHHSGPRNRPARLDRAETAAVYHWLGRDAAEDLGFDRRDPGYAIAARRSQIGQPVACGTRDRQPVSALRLCASARLVVEATAGGRAAEDAVIDRALFVLDKTALLARALSRNGMLGRLQAVPSAESGTTG